MKVKDTGLPLFLEFLETWKCQGIWLRSRKRPKSGKG